MTMFTVQGLKILVIKVKARNFFVKGKVSYSHKHLNLSKKTLRIQLAISY